MDDYKIMQLIDLFLFEKEANCSAATLVYYKSSLKYFSDFLEGHFNKPFDEIYLSELKLTVLNSYTLYLRGKPFNSGHPNKNAIPGTHLKNTSIASYQRAVRAFFRWCWDNEYTEKNIAQRYRLLKSDAAEKLPLYQGEVEQIDKLFNEKCEQGIRNLCIVHLMLDAGLRSGEVVRLALKDVIFDKNIIFIDRSKGLKSRYVPLAPKLKSLLYKYTVLFRPYYHSPDGTEAPLFLNVNQPVPMTKDTVKQLFQRIKKRTGISRVHPHLCRHTFATSYILGGGDLESLRVYMGHSDITTTSRYLHLANTYRYMDADVYKLDKVFFKRYY